MEEADALVRPASATGREKKCRGRRFKKNSVILSEAKDPIYPGTTTGAQRSFHCSPEHVAAPWKSGPSRAALAITNEAGLSAPVVAFSNQEGFP
jgi:hypothetical protein